MGDIILLSPCIPKENEEWPTPARAIIRGMQWLGFSQREIILRTGVAPRRTIRDILHQEHSRRSREGKVYKPHLMSVREIRRCIRHIAKDWSMRRLSFEQVESPARSQSLCQDYSTRTTPRRLSTLYCMPPTLYITQAS
jgi:hypothetical protein